MIHIVDTKYWFGNPSYQDRWKEISEELIKLGYENTITNLTFGRHNIEEYHLELARDMGASFSGLLNLFMTSKLSSDDIIIFTEGWKVPGHLLFYLMETTEKKPKIITIWEESPLVEDSNVWALFWGKPKKGTPLHYSMVQLAELSDVNLMTDDFHIKMMDNRIVSNDKTFTSGFFSIDQIKNYNENYNHIEKDKTKIIVPYRRTPFDNKEFLESFETELPDYNLVYCDRDKLTREEYYKELASSVLMISANIYGDSIVEIYEALSFNVHPLVPDRIGFQKLPTPFKFASEYIKANKFIRVVRSMDILFKIIEDLCDEYPTEKYQEHAKDLQDEMFGLDKLIYHINNI